MLPIFPDRKEWARALFEEGVRHLEDARVLYVHNRHAAAVASSMKAAELGLKAVLVLDGSLGWWENIHTTHTPLTNISGHAILKRHRQALDARDAKLPGEVAQLETLSPSKPGAGKFQLPSEADDHAGEANPEYPFFTAIPDRASSDLVPRIHSPARYFEPAESERYYGIARRLFVALQECYPEDVGAWDVPLPAPLRP